MAGGLQASIGQGTVVAYVARPQMTISQGVLRASSNDNTVNITGQEATAFQGNMIPGFRLPGQASTSAVGSVTAAHGRTLLGLSMAMAQGVLAPNQEADDTFASAFTGSIAGVAFDIEPTGLAGSWAQGDVIAANAQLLGQLLLAQQFHVFPEMGRTLVGLGMTLGQGDLLSEGGTPFEEVVTGVGAAGRRRYAYDFAIKVSERHYRFTDVDALVEFLSKEEKETEEKARAKAARDAKRIVRLGPSKASPEPPKLQMASAMPEIVEYIAEVQKKIERAYWAALQEHLGVEAEELEDIKFLASIDL